MKLRGAVVEDFVNYKKPSMFLITPYCDFKCERENGEKCCQNSDIMNQKVFNIDIDVIVDAYISNKITKAVVIGGLEPFFSISDVRRLIVELRHFTDDDVVIYTGYNKDEIVDEVEILKRLGKNIIIKYGRYIPGNERHFDEVLGVYLASNNQYAERIS